jgi:peptidoglycan/LPS O-acetylase OafA/YrhL
MVTVLCLVATWLIASASFELVEKRFLLLKRRFTARAVLADS